VDLVEEVAQQQIIDLQQIEIGVVVGVSSLQ